MVNFVVDSKIFKEYIEKCSMEGMIQFKSGKGVSKNLFNSFFLDINPEGRLEVIAMDTVRKKTSIRVILSDVEVVENGIIPIMDQEAISKVLGGKGVSGNVNVYDRNSFIYIETDKDQYEITQRDNPDVKIIRKKETVKVLEDWVKTHEFREEDGVLVLHHPTKGDFEYPMRITVNKADFLKVVGDSINLTKDNKIRLQFEDGVLRGYSGASNSQIKGKHEIGFEDNNSELIAFDKEFYSIQTIIPNLFDHIELNIRYVKSKDMIVIYIRSIDVKKKMTIHMSLTSIIERTE